VSRANGELEALGRDDNKRREEFISIYKIKTNKKP
jgi:hypothetical protein